MISSALNGEVFNIDVSKIRVHQIGTLSKLGRARSTTALLMQ